MPESPAISAKPLSNPHRTRDLILVACSFAVAIAAVVYRNEGFALGLDLLAAALFWLAVLDSSRNGRGSRVVRFAAVAFLIGIGVIVLIVAGMVMMPRAAPVPATPTRVTLPAPTAPGN